MVQGQTTSPVGEDGFPRPFGKYLLTELLAVGGMAEVYRAKIFGIDGFEKTMVVKKILPKYAKRQSFVQMFIDEAKIAVALTHGNIVPIYELGEIGGAYYIAMEYVEGPTVLDVLRVCFSNGRSLPAPYALYIAAEVAKGLGYAHGKKGDDGKDLSIVHRDINPRNIVITPGGEVKILDFGIARASTRRHQTASGVIKGTPGYMSPEQLFGYSIDPRSDLYCLGIILHELLVVRRLFRVKDVATMRMLVEKGAVQPPSSYRPELGNELDPLLSRMLAIKPEERFNNAQDLEEALRGLIARSGMPVTGRGLADLLQEIQNPDARSSEAADSQVKLPDPGSSKASTSPGLAPGVTQPPPAAAEVLSQAPFEAPPRAPRPSPMPLASPTATPTAEPSGLESRVILKTSVLAKNDDIDWAKKIGEDAELLAIANASGLQPRSLLRTLAPPLGILLLVLGALAFAGRDQLPALWRRAIEQRSVHLGAVVVKTYPAGAEIKIDGTLQGKAPIRVDNIDIDVEHSVEISPVGEAPIKRFVGPGDWEERDGKMVVKIHHGYDKLPEDKKLLNDG